MALQHDRITHAGAVMAGVSVDGPGRNAGMVDKLGLPFPLLADPDGAHIIKPYGVWHEEPSLARPAVIVVGPDREEAFRWVSRDFADRLPEEDVAAAVEALDLDPVSQDPPTPGEPHPSDRAFALDKLNTYFRGVRFASVALKGRVSEVADEAGALAAEADRYLEALKARRAA